MADKEKIEAALNEMLEFAGGMLSVRTVAALMGALLQRAHEITIAEATRYLETIAEKAGAMASGPHTWTDETGRFSDLRYDEYYATSDKIAYILAQNICRMDIVYGADFRVDGAQDYLRKVAENANWLVEELQKKEKEA